MEIVAKSQDETKENYGWDRNKVCAGRLIWVRKPLFEYKKKEEKVQDGKDEDTSISQVLHTNGYAVCRKILFCNTSNGIVDVRYTSPNYSIVSKAAEIKLEESGAILIEQYVNLRDLLIYLGYESRLSNSDIKRIYKSILNNPGYLRQLMEQVNEERKKLICPEPKGSLRKDEDQTSIRSILCSGGLRLEACTGGIPIPRISYINGNNGACRKNVVLPSDKDIIFLMDLCQYDEHPSSYEEGVVRRRKGMM